MDAKIVYTKPRQIPLFEEQEDGSLKQYKHDEEWFTLNVRNADGVYLLPVGKIRILFRTVDLVISNALIVEKYW